MNRDEQKHWEAIGDRLLRDLDMEIISDADIAAWNAGKNECGMFERDVELPGWDWQDGLLVKEFYVTSNEPDTYGEYRKAWLYTDEQPLLVIITDADHKEIFVPRRCRDLGANGPSH